MRVRSIRKSLLLLAVVIAVPTGNADAQEWDAVKDFLNVCLSSSLQPCASVIVKTRVEGGITLVELMVRNEQGTFFVDQTGGSFLRAIGLTAPSIDVEGLDDLAVTTMGDVGEFGDPLNPPDPLWIVADRGLGGQVEFQLVTDPGKQGGIRGCDEAYGTTADYFITCDQAGYTGWVVFSFTTTTAWSATDAEIALKYVSIEGEYEDLSLVCRTEDEGGEHACAVVPEPSTWALLLTGLVGVLGTGWLRRKEEETT